jgi:hypothetical protein
MQTIGSNGCSFGRDDEPVFLFLALQVHEEMLKGYCRSRSVFLRQSFSMGMKSMLKAIETRSAPRWKDTNEALVPCVGKVPLSYVLNYVKKMIRTIHLGNDTALHIRADIHDIVQGPYGAVWILLGGRELGRSGEVTFFLPVLHMLEEMVSWGLRGCDWQRVTATEHIDDSDLWLHAHGDALALRWVDSDTTTSSVTVSCAAIKKTVDEFRQTLASISTRISPIPSYREP